MEIGKPRVSVNISRLRNGTNSAKATLSEGTEPGVLDVSSSNPDSWKVKVLYKGKDNAQKWKFFCSVECDEKSSAERLLFLFEKILISSEYLETSEI